MVGIISYGAYIPYYRLSRADIARAWGGEGHEGEKAVANYDEDSITMGVAAAMDCTATVELKGIRALFNGMYKRYATYRATGVVLMDLVQDTQIQYSLFEDPLRVEKIRELYEAVDALSGKYGKHTLHLGASHPIEVRGKGRRGMPTVREQTQLYGETRRQHLGLPLFQTGITGE